MMSRRGFVAALVASSVFATPAAVAPQPAGKVYHVGFLGGGSGSGTADLRPREAFRQALRQLGWVEGQNLVIDYRYAEGRAERLPALAAELVRLNVDLIAASPTPAVVAAKAATRTIPIVGISLTEPVRVGLVASLARPGGNVTGVTYGVDSDIFGKQLALLKEAVPRVRRVAVLSDPTGPAHPYQIGGVKTAARSLGLQLQILEAREAAELDGIFAAITRERSDALLVVGYPIFFLHRARLTRLALENRLPSMSTQVQWAEAGGLMSYGPSLVDIYKRGATYVDKILKGARPAELPIEEPTRFELVVNAKTAKALGVTIPQSLLLRADHVID